MSFDPSESSGAQILSDVVTIEARTNLGNYTCVIDKTGTPAADVKLKSNTVYVIDATMTKAE